MITIREYVNKHIKVYESKNPAYGNIEPEQWVPWLKDMTITEFSKESFASIKVVGKEHKQDLMTTLKRLHSKAITYINKKIKEKQQKEKKGKDVRAGHTGYYWRKARHKTIPLHEDLEYLRLLDKLFFTSEKWDTEKDEFDMPISKKLKWRHPYAKDLRGMLILTHLKTTNNE
tara:strand:+ start:2004 stop:2522 length:519 start_codon:yes stop_codon:yes gene_type:complete